jgi:hypothetical protein
VSESTSLSVPAAGWYPDRSDPRVTRWWDGQQWTDHIREVATAVAASVVQPVSAAAFALPVADVPDVSVADPSAPVAVAVGVTAATLPTASAAIPAGWYADNTGASLQRWWDGSQWTTHTAARAGAQAAAVAPVAAPVTSAYAPNPSYALAPGSMYGASSAVNSLATRGMIYSLIALVLNPLFIMSIGGLVNGIRSLRRAPNFLPADARRGQAIVAIVVGVVATLLTVFAIVSAVQVYAAAHAGAH